MNVNEITYAQLSPVLRIFLPRKVGGKYPNVSVRGRDRNLWAVIFSTGANTRTKLGTFRDKKVAGVVGQAVDIDPRLADAYTLGRWLRDMQVEEHARAWLSEHNIVLTTVKERLKRLSDRGRKRASALKKIKTIAAGNTNLQDHLYRPGGSMYLKLRAKYP